jgi:antitoxin MazE
METKLVNIGNSKGIRIPKRLIEKYHLGEKLSIEELHDGILIKADTPPEKYTWEQTYIEMAKENEDWTDFDSLSADGIE